MNEINWRRFEIKNPNSQYAYMAIADKVFASASAMPQYKKFSLIISLTGVQKGGKW